jgi:hypothetical protein
MIGRWIRPWPGETIVGYIYALSGEWLICRAAGGVEFKVNISAFDRGAELISKPPSRPLALNSWNVGDITS